MCLGLPGKILEITRADELGLVEGSVEFDGIVKRVNLSFTPEVEVGEYVIVHVGFSISRIDEESARQTMDYLREVGEIEAELGPPPRLGRRTMKYVSEFRDPRAARALVDAVRSRSTRPWRIMEVCGGQTHTLIRAGIDQLLEGAVSLIHGPGCPVCVTPLEKIDRALAIAQSPGVLFATFGDMARVPGSSLDLLAVKARGADVRIVYSPLDAVALAEQNPDRQVVFFAVGFETTAPANAMAVAQARRRRLSNFSILVSHVRVPPAVELLLQDPDCRIQGFIGPGHVCSVMGAAEYERIVRRHRIPLVIAGFEPLDLLQGILMVVEQLESGAAEVQNQYGRSVRAEGNLHARETMEEIFEFSDMAWRGIGVIPNSGLRLREAHAEFDAERRFDVGRLMTDEPEICIAGAVLQGKQKPSECPAFGRECTPESPQGAPMVSTEGACAAYYAFRRFSGAAS